MQTERSILKFTTQQKEGKSRGFLQRHFLKHSLYKTWKGLKICTNIYKFLLCPCVSSQHEQCLSRPISSSSTFSLPTARRIRSTTARSARRSSSSRQSYRWASGLAELEGHQQKTANPLITYDSLTNTKTTAAATACRRTLRLSPSIPAGVRDSEGIISVRFQNSFVMCRYDLICLLDQQSTKISGIRGLVECSFLKR